MSQTALLLMGVMLGFVGSSLVALWMALSDPAGIQGALNWLLGDLSRAQIHGAAFILIVTFFIAAWMVFRARHYDRLLMGELTARTLGVHLVKMRLEIIFLSSVLVALAVSFSGMIGFIGLLTPHAMRYFLGTLHRRLIPGVFLFGGATLVLADLISRVIAPPFELPVGVITALVGSPLFCIFLLGRRSRE